MKYAYCNYIERHYPGGTTSASGTFTSSAIHLFYELGSPITILTPSELVLEEKNYPRAQDLSAWATTLATVSLSKNGDSVNIPSDNVVNLSSGTYELKYEKIEKYQPDDTREELELTYTFSVIENRYPTKKYTVLDVVQRACELVEPLNNGEYPKFRLQGLNYKTQTIDGIEYGVNRPYITPNSQADELDKILSPEFAFTKMTLREQLQQVGGFIHGEPRITDIKTDETGTYYEFRFDKYGGIKKSNISRKRYITKTFSSDINEYCTGLDSSVDNLVNQLDYAQGVITEPFNGNSLAGGQSLRTEFSAVFKRLSVGGKMSLRRYQFELAKHNATMAIFLGKNFLGQTDNQEVELSGKDKNKAVVEFIFKDTAINENEDNNI